MFATLCRRSASLALILLLPATLISQNAPTPNRHVMALLHDSLPPTLFAQDAPTPFAVPDRQVIKQLQNAESNSIPVTLIETDGTRLRGIVNKVESDSILFVVTYGTPATRIPLSVIAGLEQPPNRHKKLVIAIILAAIAAALVGIISDIVATHKANNP